MSSANDEWRRLYLDRVASEINNDWFKEYMRTIVDSVTQVNTTMMEISKQVTEAHSSVLETEKCVRSSLDTFSRRMFWLVAGILTITAGVFGVKLVFPAVFGQICTYIGMFI